jgi:hypothetical protein
MPGAAEEEAETAMSATTDLHDLRDFLEGARHGSILCPRMSTVAGAEALAEALNFRGELRKLWSEQCSLRARLAMALRDVDGLRATNERLTDLIEPRP